MLPAPMEILELHDGESASFHVTQFQLDEGIIRPAHAPAGKAIRILRVHVQPTDKKTFPYYWDITGSGAIAQLLPMLEAEGFRDREIKITATGEGAKKRHMVSFLLWALLAAGAIFTPAAARAATIELSWSDNSTDETGFIVERRLRTDPVSAYKELARVGANVTATDDATAAVNTQYCYRVRAFNPSAMSEFSNEACMMVTPSGLIVRFKAP